ncbi:MAG: hypothetical protein WD942_03085 [Dehalococcoidia bacterium]
MRTWVDDTELLAESVREAARQPVLRIWEDSDAMLWRVSLEFPLMRDPNGRFDSKASISFRRGSFERRAVADAETPLGELTSVELEKLLRDAAI